MPRRRTLDLKTERYRSKIYRYSRESTCGANLIQTGVSLASCTHNGAPLLKFNREIILNDLEINHEKVKRDVVDLDSVQRFTQSRSRIRWTVEEEHIIESFFSKHTKLRISPKREEVLQLMKLHPNLFKDQKWEAIKVYICNKYNCEGSMYPILCTDIKEEPTHLMDPLLDGFIKTEVRINIKEEPKNDRDVGPDINVEEETENDTINEKEKIKSHTLFIVSQPPPVTDEDEIKEITPDPLQVVEPVVRELPSSKPCISIRDIRSLTQKTPIPILPQMPTEPLKLRKVSRAEVLSAISKQSSLFRIPPQNKTKQSSLIRIPPQNKTKQYSVKNVQLKPPLKVCRQRINRTVLNSYLLKAKLSNKKYEDSGNDLLNQMRKRIRVISINRSNRN